MKKTPFRTTVAVATELAAVSLIIAGAGALSTNVASASPASDVAAVSASADGSSGFDGFRPPPGYYY